MNDITDKKMNLQLLRASYQHKEVMNHLMQLYMYDFSEFVDLDVEADGLFPAYFHLEDYWKEDNYRCPYLIKKEEKYAGFVLVRYIETKLESHFSIAEFFVMKKYRRSGIGKTIAHQIFNLHKGQWEVFQKEGNKPAQLFWKKVIDEYTDGNFVERFEDDRRIQNFRN